MQGEKRKARKWTAICGPPLKDAKPKKKSELGLVLTLTTGVAASWGYAVTLCDPPSTGRICAIT